MSGAKKTLVQKLGLLGVLLFCARADGQTPEELGG